MYLKIISGEDKNATEVFSIDFTAAPDDQQLGRSEGGSAVFPLVESLLENIEEAEGKSTKIMKPKNMVSKDPLIARFGKDLANQQTLRVNDLFNQLKKIITSPESKTFLGDYVNLSGQRAFPRKYYFNNDLLVKAREMLKAAGVQRAADLPPFLLKAGVAPEHSYYLEVKRFMENVLTAKKIDLTHWLSAGNVYLLLTVLIKGCGQYTAPFDLAESPSHNAFYFFSTIQDILLGSFTNLAELTLERFSASSLHQQAGAVFKISFKDKEANAYEKLLGLLLILGRLSTPGNKINIYCPDNDREAWLNNLNFYVSLSRAGDLKNIPYTEAIKVIENHYIYVQKMLAELDAERNNPAVSDFQEITPLLSKALIYLDPAPEIQTEYFAQTGPVWKLPGGEIILPFVIGEGPGRVVFGLYGEYQHGRENIKVRAGFNRSLQAQGMSAPDFSIALDYQRLSGAAQNYFSKINQTPLEEMSILLTTGYGVRLIERINSPLTKADFIEKIIELLYVNYNSLSDFEQNLFEDRLVLAAYNTSATDRVKSACQNALKRLADADKISVRGYKPWLSQDISYRGLELYAGELIKELKIFQKRRQSYNMTEFLTEMLLGFLPLVQKIKSNSRPVEIINKLWYLEKKFLKERNLVNTERLLAELVSILEDLHDWLHREANLSEEMFYKPLWDKAPSENIILARLRPLLINLKNVVRNVYNRKTDDWDLFIQFIHELDARRQQRIKYENLIPALELIDSLLGASNYAVLLPLIEHEMRQEIIKFLPVGHNFDQAWHYQGNGSASAFTIGSIIAYAHNNEIMLSVLAEDLYQAFAAVIGSVPGLSKTSIENKLLHCANPDSGVSVNAGIEKILMAIIKKRTRNLYCAYDIGLCCNNTAVVGKAIYNMIRRVGSESAMKMVEGTAAKFHDHKKVTNLAVGSLLSPENELCVINLLEFNEKGRNYDLLGTLDILLWSMGALACIPQIADGTRSARIQSYLYVEQGQQWEELKKAKLNLQSALTNPAGALAEYEKKARALRERLISVYLGFTFPKGRSGVIRNIVRGSADMYDYLMSTQLLAEASQRLKDRLGNYNAENLSNSPMIIQTPQVEELLAGSGEYTLSEPVFLENVGLVQKISSKAGRPVDYLVYGEYADSATGKRYLTRRLLSDNSHRLPLGDKKLKETSRSIRHFTRVLEQGLLDPRHN